jgi:hemolysin III
MQNPVRGLLHGTAAIFSIVALVVLIVRTIENRSSMWSMVFFGASLILFLLIAGTFTPIAYNVLAGRWRSVTLSVVWGIAIVGIGQKIILPRVKTWFSVTLQMTMGWFAVVPIAQIAKRLPVGALVFLLLGGLSYTVGMVIYATGRPRLFPRVFSAHEVFHILVVVGSLSHFLVVYLWVVPLVV